MSLTYFFALVGGIIGDSSLGLFKTIVVGTLVFFAANLFLLAGNVAFIWVDNQTMLLALSFCGIVCFICGAGLTKACISAFLGDQFRSDQSEKRSRWYSWYYLSIQFAVIAISIGGPFILKQSWGAWALFIVTSAAFPVFFPFFLANYKNFNKKPPEGSVFKKFFQVIGSGCRNRKLKKGNRFVHSFAKFLLTPSLVC